MNPRGALPVQNRQAITQKPKKAPCHGVNRDRGPLLLAISSRRRLSFRQACRRRAGRHIQTRPSPAIDCRHPDRRSGSPLAPRWPHRSGQTSSSPCRRKLSDPGSDLHRAPINRVIEATELRPCDRLPCMRLPCSRPQDRRCFPPLSAGSQSRPVRLARIAMATFDRGRRTWCRPVCRPTGSLRWSPQEVPDPA